MNTFLGERYRRHFGVKKCISFSPQRYGWPFRADRIRTTNNRQPGSPVAGGMFSSCSPAFHEMVVRFAVLSKRAATEPTVATSWLRHRPETLYGHYHEITKAGTARACVYFPSYFSFLPSLLPFHSWPLRWCIDVSFSTS